MDGAFSVGSTTSAASLGEQVKKFQARTFRQAKKLEKNEDTFETLASRCITVITEYNLIGTRAEELGGHGCSPLILFEGRGAAGCQLPAASWLLAAASPVTASVFDRQRGNERARNGSNLVDNGYEQLLQQFRQQHDARREHENRARAE